MESIDTKRMSSGPRSNDKRRGDILQIPTRIRCTFERLERIQLLNDPVCGVERALHAVVQTYAIDCPRIGNGSIVGRAGPYLHYNWDTREVVAVPN